MADVSCIKNLNNIFLPQFLQIKSYLVTLKNEVSIERNCYIFGRLIGNIHKATQIRLDTLGNRFVCDLNILYPSHVFLYRDKL